MNTLIRRSFIAIATFFVACMIAYGVYVIHSLKEENSSLKQINQCQEMIDRHSINMTQSVADTCENLGVSVPEKNIVPPYDETRNYEY